MTSVPSTPPVPRRHPCSTRRSPTPPTPTDTRRWSTPSPSTPDTTQGTKNPRQTLASPPGRPTSRRSRLPGSEIESPLRSVPGRLRPMASRSSRTLRRFDAAPASCWAALRVISPHAACPHAACPCAVPGVGQRSPNPVAKRKVYEASPRRPAAPDVWHSSATPRSPSFRSAAAAVRGSMCRWSATRRAQLDAIKRPLRHSASKARSCRTTHTCGRNTRNRSRECDQTTTPRSTPTGSVAITPAVLRQLRAVLLRASVARSGLARTRARPGRDATRPSDFGIVPIRPREDVSRLHRAVP